MSVENVRPLVLHVRGVTGFGGGPEKTILNSPRFLRKHGFDAVCAYMHPPNDSAFDVLTDRANQLGATLASVPDRGPMDFSVLRRLSELCRQESVAIWHGHDYKSNVLGLLVNRVWPMKLVTTVHGWVQETRRTPLYYRIDKFCLRYYDHVVCVSDDLQSECRRLGVRKSRCHLIENGIDTNDFDPATSRQEGRLQGRLVLGAMGRLSAEKGFDLLIRSVDRVMTENDGVTLLIAGEGECRDELQRLIVSLGRQGRIRLLGHVDNPQKFFGALDVFVLSSIREGLPNVLLEAMALEVPVIATSVAGIPRLIDDGKNGLLVPAGSIDRLSAGILALVNDRDTRHRLAKAARATIEQSYSFEHRMCKIATLYDRLLGRRLPDRKSLLTATQS